MMVAKEMTNSIITKLREAPLQIGAFLLSQDLFYTSHYKYHLLIKEKPISSVECYWFFNSGHRLFKSNVFKI